MTCKHCNDLMTLEGDREFCCDNCGATYDAINDSWTDPTVPPEQRNIIEIIEDHK